MTDPIFQKNLQDLVKGMRTSKQEMSSYISQSISDIKTELKARDNYIKAEAVRKLTFLQMMGYDVSWASFAIIEVMSQEKFAHKRIGYLAANQTFNDSTDVILLTTNHFKRELSLSNPINHYEIGLAINSLANIVNKDLARDCLSDVLHLMSHSKPYIRKKAVLAMYKLYTKYPQGLRLTFDKLKDRLNDEDNSVISSAVNVICELSNKNPKNYLSMAPKFFSLLSTFSNNWMLIKVVKLLGSLVSEEPRLARKLLDPLAAIIKNTSAKSLQFECINTLTEALPYSRREDGSEPKNAQNVIKLCADHLKIFVDDPDQNLKYLGLVGFVKLLKSSPATVMEQNEIIEKCLDDEDITIRSKSVELLAGIVTKKTVFNLIQNLLDHLRKSEGIFRSDVMGKILSIGRRDKFNLISDFPWYASILLELSLLPINQGPNHTKEISEQLIEISLRVEGVRPYVVDGLLSMLLNEKIAQDLAKPNFSDILCAGAWTIGEYSEILSEIKNDDAADDVDDDDDDNPDGFWILGAKGQEFRSVWKNQNVHLLAIQALLNPRALNFPAHIQSVFIHSVQKIFIEAVNNTASQQQGPNLAPIAELADIVAALRQGIPVFTESFELEVRERSRYLMQLLRDLKILPKEKTKDMETLVDDDKSLQKKKKTKKSKKPQDEIKTEDLDLIEIPMQDNRVLDQDGAIKALESHKILSAAASEVFYAVHSKAQKRVPIPEDLTLATAFAPSAIDAFLDTEIKTNEPLTGLRFLPLPSALTTSQKYSLYEKDAGLKNEANDLVGRNQGYGGNGWEMNTVTTGTTTRQSDDVFILTSKNTKTNPDAQSSALGSQEENLVEEGTQKTRRRESKKKTKMKGKVDIREMLPAGAMDSSDDEKFIKNKKIVKNTKNTKKNTFYDDELEDLEKVDLSAPLRPDEIIPTLKHREVPTSTSTQQLKLQTQSSVWVERGYEGENVLEEKDLREKEKIGGKKHKKDKKSDKTKENGTKKSKGDKEEKKKKSKKTSNTIEEPKVGNLLGDDWSVSETIKHISQPQNPPTPHRAQASNPNQLIDPFIGLEFNSNPVKTQEIVSEKTSSHTQINLIPLPLSETQFQSGVSQPSANWGSATVKIQITSESKSKVVFKALKGFLNAYLVETEVSKAAFFSAAVENFGVSVYFLSKFHSKKEGKNAYISVDIKCLSDSRQKSDEVVNRVKSKIMQFSS